MLKPLRLLLPLLLVLLTLTLACGDDAPPPAGDTGVVDATADAGDTGVADAGDGGSTMPICWTPATPGPTVTNCMTTLPTPAGTDRCVVTPGTGALRVRGNVLTPGEVFRGGEVLVNGAGTILCVGCDCTAMPEATGATEVACPLAVISPGLVNAHDHITFAKASPYTQTDERYEHRHEWRRALNGHTRVSSAGFSTRAEVQWGELRMVMGGATSINGSGTAAGFLRNLDRTAMEGLGQPPSQYDTFPLGDSGGELLDTGCAYPSITTAMSIAAEDAYTPHVSEGISLAARNEFVCLRAGPTDLIEPQTAIIHGIGLTALDISELASSGSSLVWSARTNVALYGDTARVTAYASMGVRIALGTDWLPTGSMNMLRELRCADSLNVGYFNSYFTDEQLWLMATESAAGVLAMDDAIGVLAPGRIADIAIFDASVRSDHRAVIDANPDDVILVLRGGTALYGDAGLVAALPGGAACDPMMVCGSAKRACVTAEIGMSLTALQTANATRYPLFFCGVPDQEPSCVPARNAMAPLPDPVVGGSTRYDGLATATDGDGDGIDDMVDNCLCTFNPIRPLDMGAQADFDGDGLGDACDPCPLEADLITCAPPDPNDRDRDGWPNAMDNCPHVPNPLQEDRDMDMKGDACDACPDQPNPGVAACPATIYDVKDGTVVVGASVAITGPVVTAVARNGFFVQVAPGDPAYVGPDNSAVFIYTSSAPTVAIGDQIDLTSATVANFFGQIQLVAPVLAVTVSGVPLPPAEVVLPAEVATGGLRASVLEAALVTLSTLMVADVAPAPGPGDSAPTGEFTVNAALRVDDLMYSPTPFVAVGEQITTLTGVLAFRNGNSKVEPRDAADVLFGVAALVALSPALSYAREGAGAGPTIPSPLLVRLARPVAGDTTVTILSSGAGLGVTDVIVPAGSTSAPLSVTGVTAAVAPYTVTAILGAATPMAQVRVLGAADVPRLVDLRPPSVRVPVGGTATFTVALDLPAAGDTVVTLAVDMGGAVPPTALVRGDQLTGDFLFTAGMAAATSTITATLGADIRTSVVDVSTSLVGTLVINEIDYDQPRTDTGEFLEIHNRGVGALDLTGVAVVLVNGNGSAEYRRFDLTGMLAGGGYFVIANASVVTPGGVPRIDVGSNTFQNGAPDGVLLYDTAAGTIIDALSYEGAITAASVVGAAGSLNLVEGTALSASDSGSTMGSLARIPNGTDTDDAASDWAFTTTPTPGVANVP